MLVDAVSVDRLCCDDAPGCRGERRGRPDLVGQSVQSLGDDVAHARRAAHGQIVYGRPADVLAHDRGRLHEGGDPLLEQ